MGLLSALTGLLTGCAAPPETPPTVEWQPAERVGHGSPRLALPMPDRQVAVATTLGVGVWRLDGGPPLWFAATDTEPLGLSSTPDGRLVGAALAGGWVQVWRAGQEVFRAESEGAGVALAPDGRAVALGRGGQIRLIGLEGDPTDRALGRLGARLAALAFDGAGGRLAAVDRGGLAAVWSADGAELGRLEGQSSVYHSLAWSADGRLGLAGSPSALWTPGGPAQPVEGLVGPALSVAFSADDQRVVLGGQRGGLVESDAATGQRIRGAPQGSAPVRALAALDGGWLIVGGAVTWAAHAEAPPRGLLPLLDAAYAVALSADGRRVAALGPTALVLWGEQGGAISLGVTHGPLRLAFLPDGRALAITARELLLVEPERGDAVYRQAHAQILAADLSSDGATVALVTRDGGEAALSLVQASTGEPLPGPAPRLSAPTALRWSADGALLAIADAGEVRVIEVATGAERGRIADASGRAGTLAWAADGRLAVGLRDGHLSVWRDGSARRWQGRAAGDALVQLAWRPDGDALAALGQDTGGAARLSVFDARAGQLSGALSGGGDVGHAIGYSPDGGLLFGLFGQNPAADGRKPGLVCAWQGSGAPRRWEDLSDQDWWSLAIGPGAIAAGDGDGVVQIWRVVTP